ncbi:DUF5342 family protein [Bacillus sp. B190/17]|uniref:DUF5342 family protein n=1 Tax=Bacillus lumedeiriae TaxID=3058829 RepID=A0ABW8I7F8_9BACI
MFEDFEVKPLFEDQVHERHQFTLNVHGNQYQGIFHDEKIHWFHPHPERSLEADHLKAVESKVHDLMTGDLGGESLQLESFEVKPLFGDQVHERHQFTLNIQGNQYQGIFHEKEISWFHPHPERSLEEGHLKVVESEVHDLMTDHLEDNNHNFEDFEVKPLFEDQVHERHQFTLNIQGNQYQGLFHEKEINWFHPHPERSLEEDHLKAVESKVHNLMSDHLEDSNQNFEDFEVKPLFEDQVHERHQFTLNIQGNEYQGLFHEQEISWFHPHPERTLEEDHLKAVESEVQDLMSNYLEDNNN